MKRFAVWAAAAVLMSLAAAEAPAVPAAPDYAQDSAWLCRPGRAGDACGTAQTSALVVDPAAPGRTEVAFAPKADAPIDCFYVYPTVSNDPGAFSDLSPNEEIATVRSQVSRLATRCRVFAPMYRQVTLGALNRALKGESSGADIDWTIPYQDVVAAWRDYLKRDNRGRGVILIGHSQGTVLLTQLLANEIDGKPAQKLLVSAFLSGHPGFGVPAGKDVGGALKTIPLCHAAEQLGCVYVWSSYAEDDKATPRFFGAQVAPGLVPACVSPAAPGGGRGRLKAFFRKPSVAPEADPPYVEAVNQLSGECVTDALGSVLRIRVEEGPYAPLLQAGLARGSTLPGWGLHILDMSLVQGNIFDVVDAETAAWARRRQLPG